MGYVTYRPGALSGAAQLADPVVSEEPEPFMEPRRTPPLPAEAAIRLVSLRHDVDPPPQVLQTDGRRDHAAPASRVVGGSAEQQGPFAPRALPRFVATTNPSATLSPSADFAAGRGGLLQLLDAAASPCCRSKPRRSAPPRQPDCVGPCCLRGVIDRSASGVWIFRGQLTFTCVTAR